MRDYEKIVAREGATFFNDHIALRSIATEVLAMGIVAADRRWKVLQMSSTPVGWRCFLAEGSSQDAAVLYASPVTTPPCRNQCHCTRHLQQPQVPQTYQPINHPASSM